MLRRILFDERAQDLIEYALLTSFLSISAIATLRILGAPVDAMFRVVLEELS
ncbi:MAG: Flp family type IVb pilin [Candidatus Zixiibacteriota bacterium]